jgi:hypothetical protein
MGWLGMRGRVCSTKRTFLGGFESIVICSVDVSVFKQPATPHPSHAEIHPNAGKLYSPNSLSDRLLLSDLVQKR